MKGGEPAEIIFCAPLDDFVPPPPPKSKLKSSIFSYLAILLGLEHIFVDYISEL